MRSYVATTRLRILISYSLFLLSSFAFAQEEIPVTSVDNSNMHMPHAAHGDMWMFEYRFMRMFMSGMLRGKDDIDPVSVLQNPDYNKLPYPGSHDCTSTADPCLLSNVGDTMLMDMHMFMIMYHQTSDLSWMVMFNYLSNTMDMFDQMSPSMAPETFSMDSGGIGDVQVLMTNRMAETDWFDINLTLGISLPLGTIDASDGIEDMSGNEGVAPYDMQMGSGTYDVITELSLKGSYYRYEYGFNMYKVTRTGLNNQFYNRGDSFQLKVWNRYTFPFGTQVRGGIAQNVWAPIEGRDERMSDNTRYTGGKRFDVIVGVGQKYKDFGIYADYSYPLFQYLNGVQMKTTGVVEVALEYMYM